MLEIQNLSFSYGEKELFSKAELKLYPNEHIGIVGLNGSGKTTLMKLISHQLAPDEGMITWDKFTSFTYLDQYLNLYDDLTINEYLYGVYEDLFKKDDDLNNLYAALSNNDELNYVKILQKAERLQTELEDAGFYMIKSKIGNIINGLGIHVDENHLIGKLSGGQRVKVFLGKMLLEEKDILLLDEPTNFLDTDHIEWLMKYLVNYKHGFITVSHNPEFLDTVATAIVSLENKKLIKYRGNYSSYLKQRLQSTQTYEKDYKKQQIFIKKTEEFIKKNIVRASTTKRAQSREKMLTKLDVLAKPQSEKKIQFTFPFTKSFNTKCLEIKKLAIGYDHILLNNLNLSLNFGDKIVIIGENGIGKTTLIKTILGEIPSFEGIVKISPYNDLVYFSQDRIIEDINALDYFRQTYPLMNDGEIQSILAIYGIKGTLALKSMLQLSGGEITKVRFAKLNLKPSNFLILDEPTNHLDRNAKTALFNALASYPGTVLLVSHERAFYKQLEMKEIYLR